MKLVEAEVAELKGQLVDTLEDWLFDQKGIMPSDLSNEDRDADSDDDNTAIIYGEDYDTIGDAIQEQLDKYKLVGRDAPCSNPQSIAAIIDGIYAGYREVVGKIKPSWLKEGEALLGSDDERRIRGDIRFILQMWDVII